MESDQYFGDLDEEIRYSMEAGPRRWLGLFAGLIVGVVLGILSSNTFVEFTFWIILGCSTACVSWVIVLLASLIGGSLCRPLDWGHQNWQNSGNGQNDATGYRFRDDRDPRPWKGNRYCWVW